MPSPTRLFRTLLTGVLLMTCLQARAEQQVTLGDYEVHYALFPSQFIKPELADKYGVVRGQDRALLNISVLDAREQPPAPVPAILEGTMTNLLGQVQTLRFREVREGDAIYYLADVRHTDRDTLRFKISVRLKDAEEPLGDLEFQQRMYWEGR